jgi:hypothetical protein
MELVGPQAKLNTGNRTARRASVTVPSFCVR